MCLGRDDVAELHRPPRGGADRRRARRCSRLSRRTAHARATCSRGCPETSRSCCTTPALQLALAQPYLPVARRLASPAGAPLHGRLVRAGEVHVLAPRVPARARRRAGLARGADADARSASTRCSSSGSNNPLLPPPVPPPDAVPACCASPWLLEGIAQFLSGQVPLLRAGDRDPPARGRACASRPSRATRRSLAGALFDLLARERGEQACVRLARQPRRRTRRSALESAFERLARGARVAAGAPTSSASPRRAPTDVTAARDAPARAVSC